MIYTVTFNPSLDYTVTVDDFKIGYTSRTTSENLLIGGKGINVSIVLKNLGFNSTALGFVAGFTGDEICKGLNDRNINTDFIKTENGFSRINVKLISNDGTEINGNGPEISKNNINEMLEKIDTLKDDDILVLAGSIPKSVNSNIYSDI